MVITVLIADIHLSHVPFMEFVMQLVCYVRIFSNVKNVNFTLSGVNILTVSLRGTQFFQFTNIHTR